MTQKLCRECGPRYNDNSNDRNSKGRGSFSLKELGLNVWYGRSMLRCRLIDSILTLRMCSQSHLPRVMICLCLNSCLPLKMFRNKPN